jgi:hypothetical protein
MADLAALKRKTEFYATGPDWVRNLWPTASAFDWFIKNNKRELERRGVIAKLARDWLVDTNTFEPAINSMLQRKDELSR